MPDTLPPPETQVDASTNSPRLFDWPSQITPAERKSLAAGGLGWMLDAMDVMLYSLVLTYLIREFSMDTRTAGFLNSLTLVASAIGGLLFGVVADRIGRTRSLMVSILVYSLASAACAFSHSVGQLALFRFVLGLGMGGEWTAAAALIAETWRPEHRGKVLRTGLLATTMNTCALFGYWGLFTWIPAYLSLPPSQGGRGLSLVKTTTFFLVLCAGKFLGYSSFGFLADAFGRRKPYFAYLITAAALVPIYGMTASPTLLLLLGPLVAFFGTGFFSGYAAIASEIFPGEIRAAAMGFSYNVGRGISAVAPFVVGALAVKHGIGPAFLVQAGAFFVAALLSLLLPETRGQRLT